MKRVLVVEDDVLLGETLAYNLYLSGCVAVHVLSVASARMELRQGSFALAVLDVNLPDGDGFRLCGEMKAAGMTMPVIFLTANDMERDVLKGYELGAEDYITKPFHISVFLKKVAVLLDRHGARAESGCFYDGSLCIDFAGMTASLDGQPIVLTPMEYRTLKVFTANPHIVLTRQVLLEKLWDADENFVDEHALTANISRIRGKIEVVKPYIKTVYGMGYMWMGGAGQ